jgi:hypothetical protein
MGRLNRPKTFGSTARGKYLKKTMKTGQYSPEMRSAIVGRTGAAAGQAAQENTARIRGYLQARGMGNSLAGTRALAEPGLEQQRITGNAARDIEIENEASKARAKDDYGRESLSYGEARRQQMMGNNQELIGGLVGASGSYAGARYANQMREQRNSALNEVKALMDAGEDEKALNMLMMIKAKFGDI